MGLENCRFVRQTATYEAFDEQVGACLAVERSFHFSDCDGSHVIWQRRQHNDDRQEHADQTTANSLRHLPVTKPATVLNVETNNNNTIDDSRLCRVPVSSSEIRKTQDVALCEEITSSTKPEVRRTNHGNRKSREVEIFGFLDMRADRRTYIQTYRHADRSTLLAILTY